MKNNKLKTSVLVAIVSMLVVLVSICSVKLYYSQEDNNEKRVINIEKIQDYTPINKGLM